jgi:tubulin delta
LYKHARQLLITGGFMEEGLNWNNDIESKNNKSLSLSLFSRGNLANNSEPSSQNLICNPDDQEALKEIHFGPSFQDKFFGNSKWRSTCFPVKLWHQPRMLSRYEKSLTLLSNSQMPVFKIDSLVSKAWNMFSAKAYIHQYVKYGNFEEEELLNAFIFAEQLIKNYKNI